LSLKKAIQSAAGPLAEGRRVAEVRIGLGYTAVLLDDGHAGVAYTFRDAAGGCSVYRNIRPLAGRPAADLLDLYEAGGLIEASLALATANALFNRPGKDVRDGDILDSLSIGPRDRVGMVGHFGPLVSAIRKKAEALHIFEQIDFPQGKLLPVAEAERLLPGCDIALLTSTALINQTAEALLALAENCREVVLLGASTPLAPEVFAGTPVTCLSGIVVVDPPGILRVVSEGGGMRYFKAHIEKVNLALSPKD
jgi:hypothetical protein